jgi:uncharacterized protein YkwD
MSGYKTIDGTLQYDTIGDDNFKPVSWWVSAQWPRFKGRVHTNTSTYTDTIQLSINNAVSIPLEGNTTILTNNATMSIEGTVNSILVGHLGRRYVTTGHTCIANVGNYTIVVHEGKRLLVNSDECMDKSFDDIQGKYYMRCVLSKLLDVITCASMLNGGRTVVTVSDVEQPQYTDMELISDDHDTYKKFLANLGMFYSSKSTLIGSAQSIELTKVRKTVRVGTRRVLMGVMSFEHNFNSQVSTGPVSVPSTHNSTTADSPVVEDSLLSIALCMVNKVRAKVGVHPVIGHSRADGYARWKGYVCAKCRKQSHSIGDDCVETQEAPWNHIRDMLGSKNRAGEILARSFNATETVALVDAIESWVNSHGHYNIMVDPRYMYMGMSYGIIESRGECVMRQWVGLFVESRDEDVNQGVIEPSSKCPDPRPQVPGFQRASSCNLLLL